MSMGKRYEVELRVLGSALQHYLVGIAIGLIMACGIFGALVL